MADSKKHTEGPWERVDMADYTEIHPAGKRLSSAIALVARPEDADLVAAAPDLLEAAWQALGSLKALGAEKGHASNALRAAISRAEGRS